MKKSQKVIIIVLFILIDSLLGFLLFQKYTSNYVEDIPNGTRTIMMYIVGSNLETEASIVTADLESINKDSIDFSNTNILLMAGGTKIWHNSFINGDKTNIYKLTSNGYEIIKENSQLNMSDLETFLSFINYGYENYNADKMDLIIYNHGGAIDGSIYDEFYANDVLSLSDMKTALSKSNFGPNNKLDVVLFRTCLNGTIEVANIYKDYADFMVASEEVTFGSSKSNVLSFINNISPSDSGIDYGKKFISAYKKQMEAIDPFESVDTTYSVIDLSKIDSVINSLNKFVNNINLTNDYAMLSRIRSNIFQYAVKSGSIYDYDTIDLYEFASKVNNPGTKELVQSINSAVVYNWTNNNESHGLSIYFPFNGKDSTKNYFLNLYKDFNFSDTYYNFINNFNDYKKKNTGFNNFATFSSFTTSKKNNEFTVKLTEEQLNTYSKIKYVVFEKTEEEYYTPIYSSFDAKVDKDGTVSTNISGNIIKVKDLQDNSESFVPIIGYSDGTYQIIAIASNYEKQLVDQININISRDKKNNPLISSYYKTIDDNISGQIVDINEYKYVDIPKYEYKILDKNGKYTKDWSSKGEVHLFRYYSSPGIVTINGSLEDGHDYYCLFMITDIYDNVFYTDLLKYN